jgi:hypothetical protein
MGQMRTMTDDEVKLAHTRTVDALQRAYAFLIALALTTAFRLLLEVLGVVAVTSSASLPRAESVATSVMAVAFLSTLVVFYQGMNRHLDDTFVIAGVDQRHRGLLLLDIFVFLIEGGILVAMANTIDRPGTFLIAWTGLLGLDIVWSLLVYVVTRHSAFNWVVNNTVFIAVAWICWLYVFPGNAAGIAIAETVRSAVDYKINWGSYFPRKSQLIADGSAA